MAKAAEGQRLFSFAARRRGGCCVRNYELWCCRAGFSGKLYMARNAFRGFQIAASDVMASEKHGQRSWEPKNGGFHMARHGLGGFDKWLKGQKWSGRLPNRRLVRHGLNLKLEVSNWPNPNGHIWEASKWPEQVESLRFGPKV